MSHYFPELARAQKQVTQEGLGQPTMIGANRMYVTDNSPQQ